MADPIVQLRSGFVRGIVEKHEDGFDYFAFKGIPYGEPPVGELRFKVGYFDLLGCLKMEKKKVRKKKNKYFYRIHCQLENGQERSTV